MSEQIIGSSRNITQEDLAQKLLEQFELETKPILERLFETLNAWGEDLSNLKYLDIVSRDLLCLANSLILGSHPEVISFVQLFVKVINHIQQGRISPTQQDYALTLFGQDYLLSLIDALLAGQPFTVNDPLVTKFQDLVKDLQRKEEEKATLDTQTYNIFIEEAQDITKELYEQFQQWGKDKSDLEAIKELKRLLHTLKGSARVAGFLVLASFCHDVETLLVTVTEGLGVSKINVSMILLQAIEWIGMAVEHIRRKENSVLDPVLTHKIKDVIQQAGHQIEHKKNKEIKEQNKSVKTAKELGRDLGDGIRIKTDLLEQLSKMATNINIKRAMLSSHLDKLKDHNNELVVDLKIIRDSLRSLQLHADASMSGAKLSTLDSFKTEFDPLEMDRYTGLQHLTRKITERFGHLLETVEKMQPHFQLSDIQLNAQERDAKFMEECLLHTRMISIESFVPRLKRMVLQISHELKKEVIFECAEIAGEMHRAVLEQLISPLEHMIRNAIDHGIETPEVRAQKQKPPQGKITLSFVRKGSAIILILTDDGCGVDLVEVKAKAISKNIIKGDDTISQNDLYRCLLHPGFSTKDDVNQISGRGIGLDIVNTQVTRLGGKIFIESEIDVGTSFTIRLPFTETLNDVLIISDSNKLYGIPLYCVAGVLRLKTNEIRSIFETASGVMEYMGIPYDVYKLSDIVSQNEAVDTTSKEVGCLILIHSGNEKYGILVDRCIGSKEIVIKSLGEQLHDLRILSGAALLDDKIVLILEPIALANAITTLLYQAKPVGLSKRERKKEEPPALLIVDDSLTVRNVTTHVMQNRGFSVDTAQDGWDAWEKIQRTQPDIVLLDLEMPRMDGYELLEKMQAHPIFKEIPVIVISSRSSAKHKASVMASGARGFLNKPFREDQLLYWIEQLLQRGRHAKLH